MTVTTGTGVLIYQPGRVTVQAWTAATSVLTDTLGPEVISGRAQYGALGTCATAELVLAVEPDGWGQNSHRIDILLDSERGAQERVWQGVIDQVVTQDGQTRVQLSGIYAQYQEGETSRAGTDMPVSAKRTYGASLDFTLNEVTLEETAKAALTGQNGDVGTGPDGAFVIGYPSSATRLTIPLGQTVAAFGNRVLRALPELQNQGQQLGDYGTEYTASLGDGWSPQRGQRNDLTPYTRRKMIKGTARGQTGSQTQTFTYTGFNPGGFTLSADGSTHGYGMVATTNIQGDVTTGGGLLVLKHTSGTARWGVSINSNNANWTADWQVTGPNGVTKNGYSSGQDGGVPPITDTLDLGETGAGGLLTIHLNVSILRNSPANSSVSGTILTPTAVMRTLQTASTVTGIDGLSRPLHQDASYAFTLPVWGIPPFSVSTPSGSQDVAGAVVSWDRTNLQTQFTTSALPSGQRGEYNPARFGDVLVGQTYMRRRA